MSVVELHPDELLDREAHGTLSPSERVRLEAHLEACTVCRFERISRQDFAAELAEEEASPLSGPLAAALATLAGPRISQSPSAPPEAPLPEPISVPTPPAKRTGRAPRSWLLVAAVLLLAGVAGAAGAERVYRVLLPAPTPSSQPASVSSPPPSATRKAPARSGHGVAAPTEATSDNEAPLEPDTAASTTALPETAAVPSVLSLPRPLKLRAPAPFPMGTPLVSEPEEVTTPPRAAASFAPIAAMPTTSAASLFAQANAARRIGNDQRAIALYRELEQAFPGTPEAKFAQAALGRLLLGQGRASAALRKFDKYLEQGKGGIAEDVLVERALTLQRLGRRSEERNAWQALLAAYPQSGYAPRARERLAALGRP